MKNTKLTKKQKDRIPAWVKYWIEQGLRTDEYDEDNFKKGVRDCFNFTKYKCPEKFITVQSPMVGALASSIAVSMHKTVYESVHAAVSETVDREVYETVDRAVRESVYVTVDAAVRESVDRAVRESVDAAVDKPVYESVDAAVRKMVDRAVDETVYAAVYESVHESACKTVDRAVHETVDRAVHETVYATVDRAVRKTVDWHYWFGGQFCLAWQAYEKFFRDVCKIDFSEDIINRAKAYELAQTSANYWWANQHFIMVCNRPSHIIKNKNGQLHCETDMAIKYRDGWGLYVLNGVRMPKNIVMTPVGSLDPSLALKEKNSDIQREIIRKIGAERMLKHCNSKILDTWDDEHTGYKYKLMTMNIGNNIKRKYLYFEHASMPGVFFAKPVPYEVEKASHGRLWILSLVEREDLDKLTPEREKQLISQLPDLVS